MRIVACLCVLTIAGVAIGADTVTAKKSTNLRRDKNAMSPRVAEVKKGQVLPVIKKDGKWYFAESEGKQGWAAESWLASEGGGMSKGLGEASAAFSGTAVADTAGDAAAVKGLEPLTGQIAKASGQDAAPIQRLIELRERLLDDGEFEKFAKEGNVGPAKK